MVVVGAVGRKVVAALGVVHDAAVVHIAAAVARTAVAEGAAVGAVGIVAAGAVGATGIAAGAVGVAGTAGDAAVAVAVAAGFAGLTRSASPASFVVVGPPAADLPSHCSMYNLGPVGIVGTMSP